MHNHERFRKFAGGTRNECSHTQGIMQNQKSRYDIIASYYSRHLEEVRGYVGSRLQYSEVTDDIVQTIFERLLTMDKMITEVTLPCLVYTVARNLLCDYWRHHHMVEEFEHKLRQRQMVDEDMRMRNEVETVYSVHEIEVSPAWPIKSSDFIVFISMGGRR